MGREARCEVCIRDSAGERGGVARAHLDNDALTVTGPARSGLKARVARVAIRAVRADDGAVHVDWPDGTLSLAVGTDAAAWAKALREPPKSLVDRLGIKPGATVSLLRADVDGLVAQLEARGASITIGTLAPEGDVVLLGVATPADLADVARVLAALRPNGALWVLHPRGVRDVADTVIFAAGKAAGLVATKVARIDDTLTGEMLVRPKRAR